MSFHNTVICDLCGSHYHLDNREMDAPPGWLVVKIVISDLDGLLSIEDEDDNFMHFCSQDCIAQYCKSEKLREQMIVMDQKNLKEESEDEDREDDNLEETK